MSYDGEAITYDGSGNPLSYRGMTFTWQAGRRLSRVVKNGVTTTFKYNVDGIRTKKGTTEYIVTGSDIVEIINGSTAMLILRDENGVPYGIRYKPSYYNSSYTDYYFVYNGQGDVVSLINSSGAIVANYEYDAWGKLLSVTDANGAEITTSTHIAHRNPFRYRGYVYDSETGLYYLQSRYYDPETGRFINQDCKLDENLGIYFCNRNVYCANNPVNAFDPNGEDAIWLQDKNAVASFGHTGLLIQDKYGNWYHFYWGNEGSGSFNKKMVSGVNGLKSLGRFKFKNLSNLNSELNSLEIYSGKYENYIYFKGNFNASINYAKQIIKDYNLIYINCMQVSIDVLLKGKFDRFNSSYRIMLRRVRINPIPNIGYARMRSFQLIVDVYYSTPKFLRWLVSPERAAYYL